ncbi:hypothetical protein U1Q18_036026 [Sarracenia purpurea var. burkii]
MDMSESLTGEKIMGPSSDCMEDQSVRPNAKSIPLADPKSFKEALLGQEKAKAFEENLGDIDTDSELDSDEEEDEEEEQSMMVGNTPRIKIPAKLLKKKKKSEDCGETV